MESWRQPTHQHFILTPQKVEWVLPSESTRSIGEGEIVMQTSDPLELNSCSLQVRFVSITAGKTCPTLALTSTLDNHDEVWGSPQSSTSTCMWVNLTSKWPEPVTTTGGDSEGGSCGVIQLAFGNSGRASHLNGENTMNGCFNGQEIRYPFATRLNLTS